MLSGESASARVAKFIPAGVANCEFIPAGVANCAPVWLASAAHDRAVADDTSTRDVFGPHCPPATFTTAPASCPCNFTRAHQWRCREHRLRSCASPRGRPARLQMVVGGARTAAGGVLRDASRRQSSCRYRALERGILTVDGYTPVAGFQLPPLKQQWGTGLGQGCLPSHQAWRARGPPK